jgi:lysozyme
MKFNPVIADISYHDTVKDWGAIVKFGILGVINKATDGPRSVDPTYTTRRQLCAQHGLLYGAYHVLRHGDPSTQADHFLRVVQPDDKVLLALDYDDPKVPLAAAKQWLQYVFEKTGRRPVLYSGSLIKQQLGQTHDPFLAHHRLWLSHYNATPRWPPNWANPWIIQFTDDGIGPGPHNVPGIVTNRKGIGISHYPGSADQLTTEWALGLEGDPTKPY